MVSVSRDAEDSLRTLLSDGEMEAIVSIILTTYQSHSVVAETRGVNDGDQV